MHSIESRLRRKLARWIWPELVREHELETEKAEKLRKDTLSLLHILWGKAKGEDYVKSEWTQLFLLVSDAADIRVHFARRGALKIWLWHTEVS